jgi:hypothetical protein
MATALYMMLGKVVAFRPLAYFTLDDFLTRPLAFFLIFMETLMYGVSDNPSV